jgi:hypothetical protein
MTDFEQSLSAQNTNLVRAILHPTRRVTSEMTLGDLGRSLDAAREEDHREERRNRVAQAWHKEPDQPKG